MIPFEEALRIALDSARRVGTERVALGQALGRILAEDVISDMDMPPFDKSSMDGYACRREDLGNELEVIETIPAGRVPEKRIGGNQCAKIMTGAMVPEGADCVFMVEDAKESGENAVRFAGKETRANICTRGEDIREGDVVLRSGALISPAHIAALAAVGCVKPLVSRRIRVGVVATGDELVEPNEKPSPSQIRNGNGPQLMAQAESMGAGAKYFGIAKDREESIVEEIGKAAAESDVTLVSGGVSVGEFDLVPAVLRKNGFELLFEKVAVQPGKPTVFGVSKKGFVFGLPGNPVSTFVLFETLVKPFLYKMMGHDFNPPNIAAPLDKAMRRKKAKRMSWVPVVFTESGRVREIEYHGSAHVHSLCFADGLVAMPVGVAEIAEGTSVLVRRI